MEFLHNCSVHTVMLCFVIALLKRAVVQRIDISIMSSIKEEKSKRVGIIENAFSS